MAAGSMCCPRLLHVALAAYIPITTRSAPSVYYVKLVRKEIVADRAIIVCAISELNLRKTPQIPALRS